MAEIIKSEDENIKTLNETISELTKILIKEVKRSNRLPSTVKG